MYCPYPRQQRLSGDFIAIRREQAAWLLVTSLKDFPRAVKLYRQRMQIEETFRDLKSLLGLSKVRVRDVGRLQVLLVALMAVYSFLFWTGVMLARSKYAKALAVSGSRKLAFASLAAILLDTYPRLLPILSLRLKEVMQTG